MHFTEGNSHEGSSSLHMHFAFQDIITHKYLNVLGIQKALMAAIINDENIVLKLAYVRSLGRG